MLMYVNDMLMIW